MRHTLTILISTLCLLCILHAEITIQTRFEPNRIALGSRAQYIVDIIETSSNRMPVPEPIDSFPIPVSGNLSLTNGRTLSRSQMEFVNGNNSFTHTQSLIIDANAPYTGNFTISDYELAYKGQTLTAPSVTLTVVERTADAAPTLEELVFLKADLPDSLYVGQTIPIELKLYISDHVKLDLNSFDRKADGFIVSDFPYNKFTRSKETHDSRPYDVLTWRLSATPIQTGPQDIAFQLNLTNISSPRSNPFGENHPFGGHSIFDDFFGNRKRFDLYTKPASINIKPLPQASQPTSFSGAIGDFRMEVHTDMEETKVGEPIMLSVKINGTGNFDRIQGPTISESPNWRSYDPESQFESVNTLRLKGKTKALRVKNRKPSDALRLKGMKRFDYVFVPLQAGPLDLPPVRFAFLNPATGQYVELKSPPLNVKVNPSLNQPPALPPEQSASDNSIGLTRSLTSEEALLTLDYRPEPARKIEGNLLRSNGFYFTHIAVLLGFSAFGLCLKKRKRLRNDADYALIQAATSELKKARRAAASAKDATQFYRHAQQAVRLAATLRAGKNLRNAEQSEIAALLQKNKARESLGRLFASANAHRFSQQKNATDLSSARGQLDTILKAL